MWYDSKQTPTTKKIGPSRSFVDNKWNDQLSFDIIITTKLPQVVDNNCSTPVESNRPLSKVGHAQDVSKRIPWSRASLEHNITVVVVVAKFTKIRPCRNNNAGVFFSCVEEIKTQS
jgi:hypothetical protein